MSKKISSDEPKLSSAALCTTLKHLCQKFQPEFTHQCVEKEIFRGHQPLSSKLARAKIDSSLNDDESVLHKSHLYHEEATSELDITIELAPSGRKCRLHIATTPKKRKANQGDTDDEHHDGGDNKRQKLDESDKVTELNSDVTIGTVQCESIKVKPMSKIEIEDAIAKALPDIVEEDCQSDYLSSPIGTRLREYAFQKKTFCLSLADGSNPETCDYHQRIQKLALWFIENADDVDVSNDQSGNWKVLYLFQKLPKGYALIGYCTLFHFNSPFHKPVPGTIVRICQALVLPPFQGQGHGKHMMRCIYDGIHDRIDAFFNGDIIQINVEDPAPGFVALRNKVDWQWFNNHQEYWSDSHKMVDISDENFFASIPEAEAIQVAAKAKITPRQVHIVNEMQKLHSLETTDTISGVSKEELERRYRLLVKRRLNKDHREDMSSFATKDAKKAFLSRMFEVQLRMYKKLLEMSKR